MKSKPDRNLSNYAFCAFEGHPQPKKLFFGVVGEGDIIIQNAF